LEQLLQRAKEKGITLHEGRSATKDTWLSTGAGKTGLSYEYVIGNYKALIKLEIHNTDKAYNKRIFDALASHKAR
jgi:tRNA 2-selenouridine synthase SelU